MYVCIKSGPQNPVLAPRPSMIYFAYVIHHRQSPLVSTDQTVDYALGKTRKDLKEKYGTDPQLQKFMSDLEIQHSYFTVYYGLS
jgi:hypothetical protein